MNQFIGKRLAENQLKVQQRGTQIYITIPSKLVKAMSLGKGSVISFQYIRENEARMVRIG